METVKLYKLKKGDHFRHVNKQTGEPEGPTYIKGRPHTEVDIYGKRQMYVTFIHAPGEPYDHNFTGYVNCDIDVVMVTD